MKKKIISLFLGMGCALSITACAGSTETSEGESADTQAQEILQNDETASETTEDSDAEQEAEPDTEPAQDETDTKQTSSLPTTLSDNLYDFQISIDGTVYQFPMWYSDFESLGWEYAGDSTETLAANEYAASVKWEKGDSSVYVSLANLSMNTAPFSECSVTAIEINRNKLNDDWEILLPGGITWGVSGTEDIKAAYGDPTTDFGGDGSIYYKMTYKYDTRREVHLFVYEDTGLLEGIELRNFVELEGADNSVSDEVPDIVGAYQKPSSVGDDLYAFQIELEGNLYALPCPLSELLANGFTINEEKSDMELGAGESGNVRLNYNNQTLRAYVKNYADYATVVTNCFVLSAESQGEFALTIPGNIQIGTSEADVKKAIADFNTEERATDSGYTYYTIHYPDTSERNSFKLCTKDGVVISIDVYNDIMDE